MYGPGSQNFRIQVDHLLNMDQILQLAVAEAVRCSTRALGGHITIFDYNTGQPRVRSFAPQNYLREQYDPQFDASIFREMIERRDLLHIDSVHDIPALDVAFRSTPPKLLYVPIVTNGTVLGTISIGYAQRSEINEAATHLQDLADHLASTIERVRLLAALQEIGSVLDRNSILDQELEEILHELVEVLGFTFATISLVDEYRQMVETVRGENVPRGWMLRSKHELSSSDIQADIVRTGATVVIDGWDDRFDREIYERFQHEELARVFTPLVANGVVIGTIEAGCPRHQRTKIASEASVGAIKRLGEEKGQSIALSRPHVLLENVAKNAAKIIGADSSSILFHEGGVSILQASAGKITKLNFSQFTAAQGEISRRAMRADAYIVMDDPAEIARISRELYSEGVRAVAAFPLRVAANIEGVLFLYFWQEHKFSETELMLESFFVQQLVFIYRTNWNMARVAAEKEKVYTLSKLQGVIQFVASDTVASNVEFNNLLYKIARDVLIMSDADSVMLYQYLSDKTKFVVPPTVAGKVDRPELIRGQITLDDAVRQIAQAGLTRFIPDVSQEPMLCARNPVEPDRPRFVEREGIKSCAVALLKVQQEEKIVGVMFVNYKRPFEFNTAERRTISTLASSVAIAINTRRLHDRAGQDLSRREKEHNAMIAVDRAIVAGATDLEHVLGLILDKALEIIRAPYGTIMLYNRWEGLLELTVEKGMPRSGKGLRQGLDEGIVGRAARTRESVLVADVTAEEWASIYRRVIPNTRAELAVPLVDEGDLLGVFNLEHPEPDAFDADDQALMETLALQAIIAIHSVTLSQKLERQIRPLRALSTIAPRIPDVPHDLDTVLRLLLVGVTAGAGLGFSRAMLFLRVEDGATLRGKLAIGARTRDEAERTWKPPANASPRLSAENDAGSLELLLNTAISFSTAVKVNQESDHPLSKAVQAITIPLNEHEGGAPAVCALRRTFVIVDDDKPDPFRNILERVSSPGDFGHAFACVPLVEQGNSIGVLVVDNRFLINERVIEEVDVKISLSAYASVAAMRIENARLQERLTADQRQATWKEFTSRMAHIIGSRISVIEGVASKLRDLIVEDASKIDGREEIQRCSKQLADGISKAKQVLTQLRQFGVPSALREEEFDAIGLIQSILSEMRPIITCNVETDLPEEPLRIRGNRHKLGDAFTELLNNAKLAVQESALDEPTIGIAAYRYADPVGGKFLMHMEFRNTGAYIPVERKERIFEPYVTSRGTGTGLGLAIVRSVVEEHRGTIREIGTAEEGVRFVVELPTVD